MSSTSRSLFAIANAIAGVGVTGLLRLLRLINRKATANFCGAVMRTVGPWLPENKTGRDQLKVAFPEKSDAEIETILRGAWDNLGRVAAEFAHLDRIKIRTPGTTEAADIDYTQDAFDRLEALRTGGKPALFFTAHLANWELPAQVAHNAGLDTVILYRRPNFGAVADAVTRVREGAMGELLATSIDAPVKLAHALQAGRHVGMLVDQYFTRGVDVTFFGRTTRANPLLARLARQIECPIHGVWVTRLPGDKFHLNITPELVPPRDAEGLIDVAGTMQAITAVVEGWVRAHPEQWLWLHRRWRNDPPLRRR